MPQLLIIILTAFASSLIAKLMLGAGLAFISYTFINDLVSDAQNAMSGFLGSIPSDMMGLLGILQLPQGLSIIMSAMGTAAFIKSSKLALGKS